MYFITTIMDTDEITNNVLLNITAGLNELNEEINYIRIKDVHPVASSFLAILGEPILSFILEESLNSSSFGSRPRSSI